MIRISIYHPLFKQPREGNTIKIAIDKKYKTVLKTIFTKTIIVFDNRKSNTCVRDIFMEGAKGASVSPRL